MEILTHNHWLNNYVLNKEFSLLAGISSNAYRYWKNVEAAKFDDARVVFYVKRASSLSTKRSSKSVPILQEWSNLKPFANTQDLLPHTL